MPARSWTVNNLCCLVHHRRRQYHQLEGRHAELRAAIEAEYHAVLARHAGEPGRQRRLGSGLLQARLPSQRAFHPTPLFISCPKRFHLAASIVDERGETHLQAAALALASHKALLPWLRDEGEVLQVGWPGGFLFDLMMGSPDDREKHLHPLPCLPPC